MSSLFHLMKDRATGPLATKPYLEDARSAGVVTYGDLFATTATWQKNLDERGVRDGATVIIDVSNPLLFSVTHLSLVALGLASVPVDPDSPWADVMRMATVADNVAFLVSDRETMEDIGGITIVRPFMATDVGVPDAVREPTSTGSTILYTSGSTGTPKGVAMDERQLLFVAQQVVRHNALTEQDRGYNSLPLFHINAEVVGLLATLLAGCTLILDRRFHKSGFWELMHERQVTWINAVPAILAILARDSSLDFPDSLRFIRSASATLPDAIKGAFSRTQLVVSWGMTEAASQITATPLGEPQRPGSVGLPVGAEVQVRENGHLLPPGESGMLWIRGDGIITSYLHGQASERFDTDGWLETGDIGRIDDDGYVSLLGRSDDVINRGGEKLYPIEIENVILQDPGVREVIVTSGPDDVLGQVPIAYVIPAETELTAAQANQLKNRLVKLCDDLLPRFKRPSDLFVMRDVPRAPTGKVKRSQLRQMAADGSLFDEFESLAD